MMAKNKTKGKKGAKRAGTKKQKAARTSTAMTMPGTMKAARSICSLTDPFCVAAVGSKWPDYASAPTIPLHVDVLYTVATNAAGSACVTFTPVFPYGILQTALVGTAGTNAANYVDLDGNLTSYLSINAASYRVVNFGIEVIPIVATMTNQGYYIVAETVGARSPGGTLVSPSVQYPNVFVGGLVGEKCAFISRPQGPNAATMKDLNLPGVTPDGSWSSVTVMVAGANASTPVLMVRVRANLEIEVGNNILYGTTATPPKSNSALLDITARVRDRMTPIIKGGAEVVEKKVMSWATEALFQAGGAAIGFLMGGPPGAAAGRVAGYQAGHMIMDVD